MSLTLKSKFMKRYVTPQPLRQRLAMNISYAIKRSFEENIDTSFNSLNVRLSRDRQKQILEQERKTKLISKSIYTEPDCGDTIIPKIFKDDDLYPQILELTPKNLIKTIKTQGDEPYIRGEYLNNIKKRFLTITDKSNQTTTGSHSLVMNNKENKTKSKFKSLNKLRMSLKKDPIHIIQIPTDKQQIIAIFDQLASTQNSVRIVKRERMQKYLYSIFADKDYVQKIIQFLQIPIEMNLNNYLHFVSNFENWSRTDILFFCFYIFQDQYKGYLDTKTLFKLIMQHQCFCDDGNLIFSKCRKSTNKSQNNTGVYTKLLQKSNLTYNYYKTYINLDQEQKRKQNLDFVNIKLKILYSCIKELPALEFRQNHVNEQLIENDDIVIVTFLKFQTIYQQGLPQFFIQFIKAVSQILL